MWHTKPYYMFQIAFHDNKQYLPLASNSYKIAVSVSNNNNAKHSGVIQMLHRDTTVFLSKKNTFCHIITVHQEKHVCFCINPSSQQQELQLIFFGRNKP